MATYRSVGWIPTVECKDEDFPFLQEEPNMTIANHLINVRRKTLPVITLQHLDLRRDSTNIPSFLKSRQSTDDRRRKSFLGKEELAFLNACHEKTLLEQGSGKQRIKEDADDDDDDYFDDCESLPDLSETRDNLYPKRRAMSSGGSRNQDKDITVDIYRRACRKLRVIPHGALIRQLTTPEVNMRYCSIGPVGTKALAISLVYNYQVSTLDLTGCDIEGLGCEYISEVLSVNTSICSLVLAENNISLEPLRCLCDAVVNSRFIEHLDLSSNNFNEQAGDILADLIEESYSLKSLVLSHNRLSEVGAIAIGSALPDNQSLEHLDLSWNHIRLKGAVGLSVGLKENSSLKSLKLGWNGFSLEGCNALSSALSSNSTLEHLDLSNNRLNADCVKTLCQCLSKNTTLFSLNLNLNPIGNEGVLYLFKKILDTPTCGIGDINIENQAVDSSTVKILDEGTASQKRKLKVTYGMVIQENTGAEESVNESINDDPLIVLMEYMRQKNMRLLDLFNSLDSDGSKSLSRKELKDGLRMVNIPLSPQGLDKLLDILDADGDGEVDFGELMEGQKEYRRRITKMGAGRTNSTENNTFTRIQQKVRILLQARTQRFKSAALKLITPTVEEPKIENSFQDVVMQGVESAQKKARLIRRQTTKERKENTLAVPSLTPLDIKRGSSPRSSTKSMVDADFLSEEDEEVEEEHKATGTDRIDMRGLPPIF